MGGHLKFAIDLALFEFEVHERETAGFAKPLADYRARDLVRMQKVNCLRVLTYAIQANIIHPRHHAEIKRALPYLTALKEMQEAAWQRAQKRISNG